MAQYGRPKLQNFISVNQISLINLVFLTTLFFEHQPVSWKLQLFSLVTKIMLLQLEGLIMWANEAEFTSEVKHPIKKCEKSVNSITAVKCPDVLGCFNRMGWTKQPASPQPPARGVPAPTLFALLSPLALSQSLLSLARHTNPSQAPLRAGSACQPWHKTNAVKRGWFSAGWMRWKRSKGDGARQLMEPCS